MFSMKRGVISPKKVTKSNRIMSDIISVLQRIPQHAQVHIKFRNRIYQGSFRMKLREESKIALTDCVQLFDASELGSLQVNSMLSFMVAEIQDVRMMRPYFRTNKKPRAMKAPISLASPKSDPDSPIEVVFSTFKVSKFAELKAVAELMREVDMVGISFCGENVGRHGKVAWIILAAGKTLIPLDIVALANQTPRLWEIMNRRIFSNDRLMKIMHDCRPAADYLLHVHNIHMANVFDTQISDALIVGEATGKAPMSRKSLSECLAAYNLRIPDFEIDALKKSEEFYDFTINSAWLTPNPELRLLKYGALQVKHLIPLHENQMRKMLTKYANCVQQTMDSINLPDFAFADSMKDPMDISAELRSTIMDNDSEREDSDNDSNYATSHCVRDVNSSKCNIVLVPIDSVDC